MKFISIIPIMIFCVFAQNYITDTLAVRAILDANKLYTVSIGSVADSSNGRITYFHSSGKGLDTLLPEIGNLDKLEKIWLYYDNLTALPKEIGDLKELKTVQINGNDKLTTIPKEIGNLVNLNKLEIGAKNLNHIPSEIGNLIILETLYIGSDILTSLPKEIGNLSNLKALSLHNTKIGKVIPEIGNLTKLSYLHIGNNGLDSLPPFIGNLTNLQKLDVNSNNITYLPPEIGNLTSLVILWLHNNKLADLPSETGKLVNLKYLALDNNSITHLTPSIGKLTNLETLTLSGNNLITLPSDIGGLGNLREISITWNSLKSLPNEIGNLTNLESFHLEYNYLTNLPDSIVKLTKFTNQYSLTLFWNMLTRDSLSAEVEAWADKYNPGWNFSQYPVNINNVITNSNKYYLKILPDKDISIIHLYIPVAAKIKLQVFKANGKLEATLIDSYKQAGSHSVKWNGSKRKSGVYFIKLTAGNKAVVEKKIVIK